MKSYQTIKEGQLFLNNHLWSSITTFLTFLTSKSFTKKLVSHCFSTTLLLQKTLKISLQVSIDLPFFKSRSKVCFLPTNVCFYETLKVQNKVSSTT